MHKKNRKKRILILCFSEKVLNGVKTYIEQLIKYMRKDYEFISFRIGSIPGKNRVYRFFYYIKSLLLYVKFIIYDCPDLIHLNPSLDLRSVFRDAFYMIIGLVFNIKILIFIHGWHAFNYKGKLYKFLVAKLFNHADVIVVLANHFKKELVKTGIDTRKIYVSSVMIDTSEFFAFKDIYSAKHNIGDVITVLFLSRFIKEKGIYELIHAIPRILEQSSRGVNFIFAGDGPERESIVALCRKLNIMKNVYFPGYVIGSEKMTLFFKSDLFILPSYTEGFPVAVLEAMASGLPIIATPVGAIPEIIEDGVNGIIIPVCSSSAIVEAVLKIANNSSLQCRMTLNNKIKASQYDSKNVSNFVAGLYDQIIG